MSFLASPTRNLFFTGKGGVGKTSLACATAITLADKGLKVLLVSTDPASNLDEVLDTELGPEPRAVKEVANLFALNIDPEQAAHDYRERVVSPYRGLLPESAIRSMEEQLSGACTLEIAAFDEFSKLLGDPTLQADFQHIVFDTAPTGHTLRLLELPAAWSSFIDENVGGTSCLGPLSGLQKQQELYAASREALANSELTSLILVARPEKASLKEAERSRSELSRLGVRNQHLAVNGIFQASDPKDSIAAAKERLGTEAMKAMPKDLALLPRHEFALIAQQLTGLDSLRHLLKGTKVEGQKVDPAPALGKETWPDFQSLMEELAPLQHGVIMTMGKGGVGKTTVAARFALALAKQGKKVLLTTTDPAAHIADCVQGTDKLQVERIDPVKVTQEYSDEVMRTAGAQLDEQGKAVLAEDLRSPCTEEIAVFRAFAEAVAKGEQQIVVIDTAPTGHTILLLDAAEAYHREVLRQPGNSPESVRTLLPRLRDKDFTKVILVALPEATPVHEAIKLEKDLKRAEITPFAWVVNQCLSPLTLSDPLLLSRQQAEAPFLQEVKDRARRMAVEPWQEHPLGTPLITI